MIIIIGDELIMIYQRFELLRIIKFDGMITNNQLWWTVYGLSVVMNWCELSVMMNWLGVIGCDEMFMNYNSVVHHQW